jgi:D-alanyl-D-alanine carboxypeptidase
MIHLIQRFALLLVAQSTLLAGCTQSAPPANAESSLHPTEEPIMQPVVSTLDQTTLQAEKYSKEELLGKFEPSEHKDFSKIEATYSDKAGIYMRSEAYESFKKMHAAAKKEGVNLRIISATRNFNYQKGIWEKKWLREKYHGWKEVDKVKDILKYSSMPGTSRHHWGTDVDFNSVEQKYFASGEGKKLYDWLVLHGSEYGFAQTYTSKSEGRTGYEEEKWHWSYMPIASEMLKEYNNRITYADLTGFSGSASAKEAQSIELYVNGIANKK